MVRPKGKSEVRYLCIVEGCFNSQAHRDEIKRHVVSVHKNFNFHLHWQGAEVIQIRPDQTKTELELLNLPARVDHDSCIGLACAIVKQDNIKGLASAIDRDSSKGLASAIDHDSFRGLSLAVDYDSSKGLAFAMDSGRGQREKKPSEKVKELTGKKPDTSAEDPDRKYPPVYTADHTVVSADVKEVEKFYQQTKVTATGEKYEFYTLGNHLENKDRRTYIRAKQDPETLYFHAAEPPPCYARWSDEGHPLCAADNVENGFTKDMLTKTGEAGQHTTRANVFAREGQFFWEAKVVSTSPEANKNNKGVPLQTVDESDKSSCQRGSIKVGFARREQDMTLPIGFQAYSYSAMRTAGNKYGSVQHRQRMTDIIGKEHSGPQPGDVIGMMITLPSLKIHEQVVKGTYNPEDHPELSYGPVALKDLKKKPGAKKMGKSKSAVAKGKEKATDTPEPEHFRDAKRRQLYTEHGLAIPPTLDILRDRNPFPYKGNLLYFECPNYTPRPDLMNAESKGRTMNPDTGKPHETVEESHPCHELPWLRTLPGSKIEVWVNGEYLGIAWEHLLAFLPPASYIEKSARACTLYGDVDDGLLGYYPALTHYGGGTVEAKFDGPWWYGYDKATFPEARPFGERYQEQIVEDFIADIVDETTVDINYGEGYMKAMVASKRKAEEQK